jgi:hypothetical protein
MQSLFYFYTDEGLNYEYVYFLHYINAKYFV